MTVAQAGAKGGRASRGGGRKPRSVAAEVAAIDRRARRTNENPANEIAALERLAAKGAKAAPKKRAPRKKAPTIPPSRALVPVRSAPKSGVATLLGQIHLEAATRKRNIRAIYQRNARIIVARNMARLITPQERDQQLKEQQALRDDALGKVGAWETASVAKAKRGEPVG